MEESSGSPSLRISIPLFSFLGISMIFSTRQPGQDDVMQFTEYIQINSWNKHCILVNGRAYIKLSRIGRGGSSKVYKVLSQDGNIYAIKHVNLEDCDPPTKVPSFLSQYDSDGLLWSGIIHGRNCVAE